MITLALSLVLAVSSPATAASPAAPSFPKQGVLVPGLSLGGVKLGETSAAVRARWGGRYALCGVCEGTTWLYTYPTGSPTGAAVTFRKGLVAAVFTLGAPIGWHSREGLAVGASLDRIDTLYDFDRMKYSRCIGYGALSMRRPTVVTSIYTHGEIVYGFALLRPSEPVCQ